jgi:hypothetical protein
LSGSKPKAPGSAGGYLLGPGDRKSIQPMAERLALMSGVWRQNCLFKRIGSSVAAMPCWCAIPKKDTHSVGVAAQYAPALGKTENCQTLVSLTLARGEVPVCTEILWDDAGKPVYLPPGKDTISFVDIGDRENPKILTSIGLENSIFGPPTNLAVHPTGEIALVANSVARRACPTLEANTTHVSHLTRARGQGN